MTLVDIKRYLSKKLSENYEVYTEDINEIKRPCIYINLVDYNPSMNSAYRQNKKITIDISYYGKGRIIENLVSNQEIYENLEIIDNIFDINGLKVLKVLDRYIHLKDQNINITDKIGHYMFDIEFYDSYGTKEELPLMQNLEVNYRR